jgi:chromosome segregation ATPase
VWLASAEGAAERARVKSRIVAGDARRVPTLEAMSQDIDALYARFGLSPSSAVDARAANEALAPLLATNLDGFAFRKELVKLAGELDSATTQLAEVRQWSEKLERDATAWAAKLEGDITELKHEIERLGAENRTLAERKAAFDLLPQAIQRYLLRTAVRARP